MLTKYAYQDGNEFYDDETDELIVSYAETPFVVRHDHDTEGAKRARIEFLQSHPEYQMAVRI